ncbi:response regulator [Mesosutterella sp. OilRF-GAM-744-9]|uniref:Response regulator n=1 Tax=Mesosutterella porci TaxID=2915351 RepID=A0ABS9MQ49_9BURK|nr:response regulator [Mesosutterella sp. oilRF-744-WT-GAM-9]MCG5030744.1 response regulator [Mesosutterella sp. oilRF-744-WT-GAM-9]
MLDYGKSHYVVRLVDDDEELLDALGFAIRIDGWSVKTYGSADAFLEGDDFDAPGCLVLDVRMPGRSGTELQEILAADGCPLPVIFLTGHGDMRIAIGAFRNGAYDFLLKPVDPGELLAAIGKAVAKHEAALKEREKASALARYRTLTEREKVILRDLQSNLSSKQIAEHLGGSSRTIQRHRQNALRKIGLRRTEDIRGFLEQVRREEEEEMNRPLPGMREG